MKRKRSIRTSDLRGVGRLAVDAVTAVTDLVETMHYTIARRAAAPGPIGWAATRGVPGLVYRSVRGITRLVGGGIDAVLAPLVPPLEHGRSSPRREAVVAAVNGVLGDYLEASGNPLAIGMSLRRDGVPLVIERAALPQASGRLLVLVHGICMSDLQWRRDGHEHGAALERDLGFTAVYLHYNSGLHGSVNGRRFAELLERLTREWPVPLDQVAIVGHSMGGLVARSACHYGAQAGHGWLARLRTLIFLGTPHHGSPLERAGNWVDAALGATRYTAPLARLGMIRSAGVTDLRFGNVLDEDWHGRDRFARDGDRRRPLPLPRGVRCCAVAATQEGSRGRVAGVLPSDGFVPLDSALGRHPDSRRALNFP
ncbi:MAG TPA: alpha/beta hydrolase, partial [Pelomicrobium sp.]|nr:alpha/beta hydrolase [Pelomicrobium sp.]